MTKQKPKVLLHIGDLHSGAKSAVACPFDAQDEDDPPLSPSKRQIELYSKLKELEASAKQVAKTHDVILILGADMIEGYHQHGTNTWGTSDDQRELATRLLMPFANIATEIYGLLGTETHTGIEGENDKAVVRKLGGIAKQRFIFDYNGVIIDCAHHARNTVYPARIAIERSIKEAIKNGDPIPNIIIRHHLHRYDHDERNFIHGGQVRHIQAAICPCWKLPDPFTRKIAPEQFPDIGALWVYPDEQKIVPAIYKYRKDNTTKL